MKAPPVDRIRALEALLRTRSLTSAAAELGVTRAMAHKTLGQLRGELNDQLLMRRGQHLILTRRAERLVDPLGETLGALDRLLEDDTKAAPRTTAAVAMRDEFVLALAPAFLRRLAAESPQTTLKIVPYEHSSLLDDLARRAIDLAVAVDPPRNAHLITRPLYREPFVCITADRTPLTLEHYLSASHVATRSNSANSAIEAALARYRHKRRIVVQVPHLAALLRAVETEGFCATLPVRSVLAMRPPNLFVHPSPFQIERVVLLAWHRQYDEHPDNRWLRDVLTSASAS